MGGQDGVGGQAWAEEDSEGSAQPEQLDLFVSPQSKTTRCITLQSMVVVGGGG